VMVPVGRTGRMIELVIEITNSATTPATGRAAIEAPAGWHVDGNLAFDGVPPQSSVRLPVRLSVPAIDAGRLTLTARANVDGRTYEEGTDTIAYRDLETRYLYKPSRVEVSAVEVKIAPDISVGYVMGIGDELPAAIAQLGARVTLLDAAALATARLDGFNAIVLGTRAYAVRNDLRTHTARLLDYVKNGGHLIVLYNTPEFDPGTQAPYPASLPGDAEEVAEEDAPVTLLAPNHPVMSAPNRITTADFEGWIEQRGSKFWSEWDGAYTPLLESHDRDQAPQRGGWLHARYGKGHYSYVAYALHRQLPFGVPGAYRLMANLLSLGTTADRSSTARP
jgi:hypothetical protein